MSDISKYIRLVESYSVDQPKKQIDEGVKENLLSIGNKIRNMFTKKPVTSTNGVKPYGQVKAFLAKYVTEGLNYQYVYSIDEESFEEFKSNAVSFGFKQTTAKSSKKQVMYIDAATTHNGSPAVFTVIIVFEDIENSTEFSVNASEMRPLEDSVAGELEQSNLFD